MPIANGSELKVPRTSKHGGLAEAIEANVRAGGGAWDSVRSRFPDVPHTTFWRTVRSVRRQLQEEAALAVARDEVASRSLGAVEDPNLGKSNRSAEGGFGGLNLLGRFREILADADRLRAYSISADGKILNPVMFSQSIALRDRLLGSALQLADAVYDVERFEAFYQAIVDEVAAESPEAARRIIVRLKQHQERAGIGG